MIKLAVFDLDGTVLDTISDLASCMNIVREMNGLPPQEQSQVQQMVGNGIRKLIERSTAGEDVDKEELYRIYLSVYEEHCTDNSFPYTGIPEMLSTLRSKGIVTAVNTNKPHKAAEILVTSRLPGLFDEVLGASDLYPLKPDPSAVLSLMEKYGALPDETVYVGDSEVDIMTGRNAGISVISVSWGFKTTGFLQSHGASDIADDAETLVSKILSL